MSQYRILHFATHGLLNSERPELSGLVFSLIDQEGRPQDGFLRLHEIYNLQLNADLVVLSACETGIGQRDQGRGTDRADARIYVLRRATRSRESVEC